MGILNQGEFSMFGAPSAGAGSGRAVRCLSLWQPWASLMACGAKIIETRSWNTKVRGEIFIHAGATRTPIKEMLQAPDWWIALVEETLEVCADKWLTDLPYGALIAKGNLIASMPIESAQIAYPGQVPFGNFAGGRFGHLYEKLETIEPVRWKGSQGFFFANLQQKDDEA